MAERLRAWGRACGVSQTEAAGLAGVDAETLGSLERGCRMALGTVDVIEALLRRDANAVPPVFRTSPGPLPFLMRVMAVDQVDFDLALRCLRLAGDLQRLGDLPPPRAGPGCSRGRQPPRPAGRRFHGARRPPVLAREAADRANPWRKAEMCGMKEGSYALEQPDGGASVRAGTSGFKRIVRLAVAVGARPQKFCEPWLRGGDAAGTLRA